MPIVDDIHAAQEFDRLCPSTVCPELTGEVPLILDRCKRASLWTASTVYEIGAVVIPTLVNRNGHRYRAIGYTDTGTDQKSDTTQPEWPTLRDTVIEDNHVIWQEDGDDYGAVLWDFIAAAREGWLLKAAKASPTSDIQTDALSIKSSQLFDHCMSMAARFQPVYCL